jgi:hypothetical protein
MVRKLGSIRSKDEKLKNMHVCELFYTIVMDTTRLLPKTKARSTYILVSIDHYSKWCKAKAIVNHGTKAMAKFLKDEVICKSEFLSLC